jgi:hypothetical protein
MPPERMLTRRKRINYRLLNGGSDDEASPEDRIIESDTVSSLRSQTEPTGVDEVLTNISDAEIMPSESASQSHLPKESSTVTGNSVISYDAFPQTRPQNRQRPAPATEWLWAYFDTNVIDREWVVKKTNKRKLVDRDIRCAYVDDKTGVQCGWKTTDSSRQTSTSNMKNHLAKHSIYPPSGTDSDALVEKKKQPDIWSFMSGKGNLGHQQVLEKNLLHWIVSEKQAFTTIESPTFRQIFQDISGIALPFSSRHTLRQRLMDDFNVQRLQLKEELATTCKTIGLSLDVWTSKNHLPIIGIIGHWLTEEFEYREKVLEFTELHGAHSGENLATAVESTLIELGLEQKLISITGDNASNNETMASELFHSLSNRLQFQKKDARLLYQGLDSYIRCLAHILNLIVKDILRALKSGDVEEANAACNSLQNGNPVTTQTALGRLRILALWIDRHPQRRQKWKEVCKINDLPDKFIEYDVDTRWNSTYRMLNDGLISEQQINKFLELQTEFPPFTTEDWSQLTQIHRVLSKFNEFTLFISKKKPQISLAVPIYYELHDLLNDASECNGDFAGLDQDLALAVKEGMKKYEKYYTFMDESDTYYTALVLDPRVKGGLILDELQGDNNAGALILQAIRSALHEKYPPNDAQLNSSIITQQHPPVEFTDAESRMLQRLQSRNQPLLSDIDRYFDSPLVTVTDTKDQNWLFNWWRTHKDEYPRMAAAARDYLAIPASEVAVERLFSAGRDLLGVRRHSMKANTMRMLMLIGDAYKN